MLKQIGVRLEEELIKKVKLQALEQGISVQSIFKEALESYFDNKITIKQDNKLTKPKANKLKSEKVNKKEEPIIKDERETIPYPTSLDDLLNEEPDIYDERYYYVVNKPYYEGAPEVGNGILKTNGMVDWYLDEGDSQFFDESKLMIPFTYRKASGEIHRPTAAEIKELEKAYERPVTIVE